MTNGSTELIFAVLGSGGHQQKMSSDSGEKLAELKRIGLVDLVAIVVGGKLMSFVYYDEIPS